MSLKRIFFHHFCLFTCLHNGSLPNQQRPPWPLTGPHIAMATGRPFRYEQCDRAEGAKLRMARQQRRRTSRKDGGCFLFSSLADRSWCWCEIQIRNQHRAYSHLLNNMSSNSFTIQLIAEATSLPSFHRPAPVLPRAPVESCPPPATVEF